MCGRRPCLAQDGYVVCGASEENAQTRLSRAECGRLLCVCVLQGTYEVNVLVAGRGATGISAIKAPTPAARKGKQYVQA